MWLARKAFFGSVPFPPMHIDTSFKSPEMIQYRDRSVAVWRLESLCCRNDEVFAEKRTLSDGAVDGLECYKRRTTETPRGAITGTMPSFRHDSDAGCCRREEAPLSLSGRVVGLRADEEGTRSKECCFSTRDAERSSRIKEQEAESWDHYKTDRAPCTHVRVH